MATSFGLNGHHQATSQKLKKSGTYSAKSSICMGSYKSYKLKILHYMYQTF